MNEKPDNSENSPEIEHNPFVNELFMFRGRVLNDFANLIEDGKMNLPNEWLYDSTPKLWKFRNLEMRDAALKLSPSASKLWTWIEYGLPYKQDFIMLNKKQFIDMTGITRQTFRSAVIDLETHCFIRRSPKTPNKYYINPRIIFYGNRAMKYGKKHISLVKPKDK